MNVIQLTASWQSNPNRRPRTAAIVQCCGKCRQIRRQLMSPPAKGKSTEIISTPTPLRAIQEDTGNDADAETEETFAVQMALNALYFYRSTISPLMPNTCRFIPSCSQYSIEAIKEFGFWKGCILTAWRLARCHPFGGKGYDPPKWPPISFEKRI